MKTSEQITYTVLAMRDKQLAEQKKKRSAMFKIVPIGAAAALAITAGVVIAANSGNIVGTSAPADEANTTEPREYIDPYIMTETMPENKPTTVWNGGAETTAPAYVPDTINETTGGETVNENNIGAEPSTEATVAATAAMTTNVNWIVPQTSAALETGVPETAVEPNVNNNGAAVAAPHWEDRAMPQRFNWFSLSNTELDEYVYTGKTVAVEHVGESRGEIKMTGFDYYDDEKKYETTAQLFRINSISESAAYAVKFDEDDGYYIFKHHVGYRPETLGQLIDDTDLINNVSFGVIYNCPIYRSEGNMIFDPVPTDGEKSSLIKQLLSECRDCKCEIIGDFREISSFSVTTNVALLGVENRTFAFFDSGYMMTNIMEYGFYFYIGEEKVAQLRQALGLNDLQPHPVSEPTPPVWNVNYYGEETTQPAHEPGEEVTSPAHGPVVEGPSEGPAVTAVMTTSPDIVMFTTSEE